MNILALDTSTSTASIAVARNGLLAAETLVNTNRTLSARIIPEIERLLATTGITLTDIDLFAASLGPGSFTGVRGGVATIQGLALATGKPCCGFSSLAMLAMNCTFAALPVCPMIDARKSEVYTALYDCSAALPLARLADCVVPPATLLAQLAATGERVIFLGDGALQYRDLITELMGDLAVIAPLPLHSPRAANGIHLVLNDTPREPSQLLPHYLRASDAELAKIRKSA